MSEFISAKDELIAVLNYSIEQIQNSEIDVFAFADVESNFDPATQLAFLTHLRDEIRNATMFQLILNK